MLNNWNMFCKEHLKYIKSWLFQKTEVQNFRFTHQVVPKEGLV